MDQYLFFGANSPPSNKEAQSVCAHANCGVKFCSWPSSTSLERTGAGAVMCAAHRGTDEYLREVIEPVRDQVQIVPLVLRWAHELMSLGLGLDDQRHLHAICRLVSVRLGKGYPNLLLPQQLHTDQTYGQNIDYIEGILVPYLTTRNQKLRGIVYGVTLRTDHDRIVLYNLLSKIYTYYTSYTGFLDKCATAGMLDPTEPLTRMLIAIRDDLEATVDILANRTRYDEKDDRNGESPGDGVSLYVFRSLMFDIIAENRIRAIKSTGVIDTSEAYREYLNAIAVSLRGICRV